MPAGISAGLVLGTALGQPAQADKDETFTTFCSVGGGCVGEGQVGEGL